MKNKARVIAAAVLTLFVLFSMSIPAFAADDCKIIIQNNNEAVSMKGHTYNAYKIFDVTYDATKDTYDYTIVNQFIPFFRDMDDPALTDELGEDIHAQAYAYVASLDNPDEFQKFAKKLYAAAGDPDGTGTPTAEEPEVAVIDELEPGYYLVYDAGSQNPQGNAEKAIANIALVNSFDEKTIDLKASVPTLEKKILGVSDNSTFDATTDDGEDLISAQINQHVGFQLDSKVPDLSAYENYIYKVTDVMSEGLTPDNNVKVVIGTEDKTGACQISIDDQTTTIEVPYDVLKSFVPETAITITYSATVNANASVFPNGDGLTNQAKLEYSNNVNQTTDTDFTPPSTVKVYLYSLEIKKVNASGQILQGAEFTVKDPAGHYVPLAFDNGRYKVSPTLEATVDNAKVVSGADGMIYIDGVSEGKYTLTEIAAPTGYNVLKNAVELNVTAVLGTDGDVESVEGNTATVVNKAGGLLPETGGIGTYIFTIGGALLMITAAFLLISKKRKANVK